MSVQQSKRQNMAAVLAGLPAEWPVDLLPEIQGAVRTAHKLVVLDDDPTGTQTVYDIPVLTEWSVPSLCAELEQPGGGFYLLTNSRSLHPAEAEALNLEIAQHLRTAQTQTGRAFTVVSRSDSTLRGHFPLETDTLNAALGGFDACLLIPYFAEGGRYTIDDTHFVAEGDALLPAGETPFAQDKTFGYRASDLRAWVAEKTGGRIPAGAVQRLSLAAIRRGTDAILPQLLALTGYQTCIVNAASMKDMQVVVAALLRAEAAGKRFLYRTAASFVQARLGLPGRPLLDKAEIGADGPGGGLVVVGSYVPKSTAQLQHALATHPASATELPVEALLTDAASIEADAIERANAALVRGQTVILYTSRALIASDDPARSLAIGAQVSASLVRIVQGIRHRPRYLLAKGGITSSDLATKGLNVRRATVLGQILPGVPVWQPGAESRFPDMPYIVFPGNVGDEQALSHILDLLA